MDQNKPDYDCAAFERPVLSERCVCCVSLCVSADVMVSGRLIRKRTQLVLISLHLLDSLWPVSTFNCTTVTQC